MSFVGIDQQYDLTTVFDGFIETNSNMESKPLILNVSSDDGKHHIVFDVPYVDNNLLSWKRCNNISKDQMP